MRDVVQGLVLALEKDAALARSSRWVGGGVSMGGARALVLPSGMGWSS